MNGLLVLSSKEKFSQTVEFSRVTEQREQDG